MEMSTDPSGFHRWEIQTDSTERHMRVQGVHVGGSLTSAVAVGTVAAGLLEGRGRGVDADIHAVLLRRGRSHLDQQTASEWVREHSLTHLDIYIHQHLQTETKMILLIFLIRFPTRSRTQTSLTSDVFMAGP